MGEKKLLESLDPRTRQFFGEKTWGKLCPSDRLHHATKSKCNPKVERAYFSPLAHCGRASPGFVSSPTSRTTFLHPYHLRYVVTPLFIYPLKKTIIKQTYSQRLVLISTFPKNRNKLIPLPKKQELFLSLSLSRYK